MLAPLNPDINIESQVLAGDNIVASWPNSNGDSDRGFLILCHFDTVHALGMLSDNPVRVSDGKMYGPGIIDMKASITQVIFALQTLRDNDRWPTSPITLLLTSDEEVGSESSRALIESLGQNADLVLCMEPALPNGELKTARKGVARFDVITKGKASHSGAAHEDGVNAIEEMAHQIIALQKLTDYASGSTISVGKITGGTRTNVVPDECHITVDMRVPTPSEAVRMIKLVKNLKPCVPGGEINITGGIEREPMPRTPEIAEAFQRASEIGADLGITLEEGSTGGGSDANIIAPYGIPILDGLGPQGDGAHTNNESLTLSSMAARTALLAGILSEW
jgi:glutamate carboxypeptidase